MPRGIPNDGRKRRRFHKNNSYGKKPSNGEECMQQIVLELLGMIKGLQEQLAKR